jgi:hypothetical protein
MFSTTCHYMPEISLRAVPAQWEEVARIRFRE